MGAWRELKPAAALTVGTKSAQVRSRLSPLDSRRSGHLSLHSRPGLFNARVPRTHHFKLNSSIRPQPRPRLCSSPNTSPPLPHAWRPPTHSCAGTLITASIFSTAPRPARRPPSHHESSGHSGLVSPEVYGPFLTSRPRLRRRPQPFILTVPAQPDPPSAERFQCERPHSRPASPARSGQEDRSLAGCTTHAAGQGKR